MSEEIFNQSETALTVTEGMISADEGFPVC